MMGNEFSKQKMSAEAEEVVSKLVQTLIIKDYGRGTIKNSKLVNDITTHAHHVQW